MSMPFQSFEQIHARLSDAVIGHVLPRGRKRDYSSLTNGVVSETPTVLRPQHKCRGKGLPPATYHDDKAELLAKKKAIRREQLRLAQARFRQKQRDQQRQTEQRLGDEMQEICRSIQEIKLMRQRFHLRGKTKPSRWNIVGEVLHLIETCFQSPWCAGGVDDMQSHPIVHSSLQRLQMLVLPSVGMGGLYGFKALTEQLRRYVLYFGDPHIEVQRIEPVGVGVVRATATLSLSITEQSLKFVFPHLTLEGEEQSLRDRLLGQRLHCSSSLTFLLDDDSGCMQRLELNVALLTSLCGVLGDQSGAARVLERAWISPEGVIGAPTQNH